MSRRPSLTRPAALAVIVAAALLAAAPAFAQKGGGALLPGGNSKAPINVTADKLEYFSKEQKAVYTGGVVAKQGETTLRSSVLSIFFSREAKDKDAAKDPAKDGGKESPGEALPDASGSQVSRMEAEGPVTITSQDQVGTGDRGWYERAENKVYLIGNVSLSQGPNIAKGEKLVYDLTTGQAQILGRVSSLFVPGSNEGKDKGDKADKTEKSDKPEKKTEAKADKPARAAAKPKAEKPSQ